MQCSTGQQNAQTLGSETPIDWAHLQPQHDHAAINAHHLRMRHSHMSQQETCKVVASMQLIQTHISATVCDDGDDDLD